MTRFKVRITAGQRMSERSSLRLQIQRSLVRFPALQYFLNYSGSGTGHNPPREDK
jgi:hypothetical protein